jgi:hypothetical protein
VKSLGEGANDSVVLGHRNFSLGTGQVIPVLVKAERVGEGPSREKGPYETVSTCPAPTGTPLSN